MYEGAATGRSDLQGTAIVCIGNPLLGDDALGLLVYEELSRLGVEAIYGLGIESVKLPSAKSLVLVDAVDAGLPPGTIIAIDSPEKIISTLRLTHGLDPKLLWKFYGYVALIGAQVKGLELGAEPSPEIRRAATIIAWMIASRMGMTAGTTGRNPPLH